MQKDIYKVYDEMACTYILETTDKQKAINMAYNFQCILERNGEVVKDFSY